ncbi:head-tail adaptor protein [Paracoccus yeei]|uniref:head-tail adaptor protein n=1 Tax=Paracoccus yeei TaxID=147645 RepID=UPI003BF8FC73
MKAGDLTKRATLLQPIEAVDADGQLVQSWAERGTVCCNVRWLRGGESVMQARLASRSPAIVTMRASTLTRRVTSEWKLRIDGREFEAKEDPRETDDRAFFEVLVEKVG